MDGVYRIGLNSLQHRNVEGTVQSLQETAKGDDLHRDRRGSGSRFDGRIDSLVGKNVPRNIVRGGARGIPMAAGVFCGVDGSRF
jgi:hypothetical protein